MHAAHPPRDSARLDGDVTRRDEPDQTTSSGGHQQGILEQPTTRLRHSAGHNITLRPWSREPCPARSRMLIDRHFWSIWTST